MFQDTFSESIMQTGGGIVLQDGVSVSVYPITNQQWEALRDIASARGESRSHLFRSAIDSLLRDRDAGKPVIYRAAARLSAAEKIDILPRAVWLKQPMVSRLKDRCNEDRIGQSDLVLEALRRFLEAEKITIDPPL